MNSSIEDLLTREEIEACIAHEMGHLADEETTPHMVIDQTGSNDARSCNMDDEQCLSSSADAQQPPQA